MQIEEYFLAWCHDLGFLVCGFPVLLWRSLLPCLPADLCSWCSVSLLCSSTVWLSPQTCLTSASLALPCFQRLSTCTSSPWWWVFPLSLLVRLFCFLVSLVISFILRAILWSSRTRKHWVLTGSQLKWLAKQLKVNTGCKLWVSFNVYVAISVKVWSRLDELFSRKLPDQH